MACSPGDPKDQGLAPCEADQMCRSNRLRFRGRPGDDSSVAVWTRWKQGAPRVKKSHGPDDLKDTTGRFYIGIPHFLTHTHPPKVLSILLLDRWHQSRQWRWRWCWRPCHHPGSYNFLAIQCTFRSKKGPNGSPRSYPSVVFITSLTIVYMYLYIYIRVCSNPKKMRKKHQYIHKSLFYLFATSLIGWT